jgi:hypothetical protein
MGASIAAPNKSRPFIVNGLLFAKCSLPFDDRIYGQIKKEHFKWQVKAPK